MTSKRNKLYDLEYVLPREFKEEIGAEDVIVVSEEFGEPVQPRNICFKCNRNSDETPLFPILYQDANDWICPKCFKRFMDESDDVPPSMSMFG
ncbi:MAG: hypothetical protein JXB14_03100 [Candidatus Altiarchaeota archaeon]|nr:hypothetical protein [Candidatus Altiarchaeota archaeon]